jgi:hypothetical protein
MIGGLRGYARQSRVGGSKILQIFVALGREPRWTFLLDAIVSQVLNRAVSPAWALHQAVLPKSWRKQMYRWMLVLVAAVAITGLAAADEAAPAAASAGQEAHGGMSKHAAKESAILNNVVKMDAAGSRTALCCCGAEFTVTANAPTMTHGGTLFYLCGDGCKQTAEKATPAEGAKVMKAWHKKYTGYKLPDNTTMKDGRKMATCLCGKTFAVTSSSHFIIENGIKTYLCSEACNTALHGTSAEDRLAKEMAELKGLDAVPPPAAATN